MTQSASGARVFALGGTRADHGGETLPSRQAKKRHSAHRNVSQLSNIVTNTYLAQTILVFAYHMSSHRTVDRGDAAGDGPRFNRAEQGHLRSIHARVPSQAPNARSTAYSMASGTATQYREHRPPQLSIRRHVGRLCVTRDVQITAAGMAEGRVELPQTFLVRGRRPVNKAESA